MSSITKKIPIAIGIKPNQEVEFTNKTIDGTKNTIQNVPTGALQFNTITINGSSIPLGGSINIAAQGGDPIIDTNTTYSIKATSVTGGASVDLDAGGSGVGTDSIQFLGGGSVTVTRSNDNTIVISDAGGGVGGNFITANSTDTLFNKDIDGNNNTISNIGNNSLTYSYITINGQNISLGGSVEIAGGGGGDVTSNSTTTFTNKTISGINNTLQSIDKSSIKAEHRYISINGTQVELGTNFNVDGLGNVTTTGTQDLSNKSLVAPIISNPTFLGAFNIGTNNPGSNGQILKSTASGITWANENRTTATALSIGSGLLGSNGLTDFDGSNGVTISVNTSVVATLTGTQTLQNKTLESPILSDATYDVTLPETLSANDTLVTESSQQTLTNKTLTAPNLTGDLTVNGVQGTAGYAIVSDGAGGLTWGQASGGGGGAGDVTGPTGAGDNAIARYNTLTGKLIQDSLVTISDTGAIVAPATGSVIPFLHSTQAEFPDASTYHGAIAHSHADGAMFFAHSGNWVQMANAADVTVSTRSTFTSNIGSMSSNATVYPDITNAYKSYLIYKITTSAAAWVRVYTSKAARSADTTRDIDVDPAPGSGVLAEIITTGNSTQLLTPATIGFNDESTPAAEIYLAVKNISGGTANMTVTLTALKLEA